MNGERSCSQKAEGSKRRFKKNKVTGGRKQRMGMSSEGSQFFSGGHAHAKGTTAKMEGGWEQAQGLVWSIQAHYFIYCMFSGKGPMPGSLKKEAP